MLSVVTRLLYDKSNNIILKYSEVVRARCCVTGTVHIRAYITVTGTPTFVFTIAVPVRYHSEKRNGEDHYMCSPVTLP